MPSTFIVPNAIIWAQFRILGGVRRLLSFAVFYAILLIAGLMGARRLDPGISLGQYCDGAIYVIALIQMILIIPGGCNAVFRGVSRDITSQMLESHRLSPMTARNVILGYIFGPTLQVVTLYLVGIIVGAGVVRFGGGAGMFGWFLGNLFLLIVGMMAWSASVVLAIGPRKPISPIGPLIGLGMSSAGTIFFPAIGLGTGTYLGYLSMAWLVGDTRGGDMVPILMAAYALLMVFIWAWAASRKFTRPDLPVFGVIGGLGLMTLWLVTNAVAIWAHQEGDWAVLVSSLPRGIINDLYKMIPVIHIVNLSVGMLFAMIAVGAAAHARVSITRGVEAEKRVSRGWPILVPIIATVLIVMAGVDSFRAPQTQRTIETLLATFFALIAFESLMTLLHIRGQRAWTVIMLFVIGLWALPLGVDSVRASMVWDGYSTPDPVFSQLFACSPIGVIISGFAEVDVDVRLGLGVQLVVAVIFGLFAYRACQRIRLENG